MKRPYLNVSGIAFYALRDLARRHDMPADISLLGSHMQPLPGPLLAPVGQQGFHQDVLKQGTLEILWLLLQIYSLGLQLTSRRSSPFSQKTNFWRQPLLQVHLVPFGPVGSSMRRSLWPHFCLGLRFRPCSSACTSQQSFRMGV